MLFHSVMDPRQGIGHVLEASVIHLENLEDVVFDREVLVGTGRGSE
jgi:hypothetical protein